MTFALLLNSFSVNSFHTIQLNALKLKERKNLSDLNSSTSKSSTVHDLCACEYLKILDYSIRRTHETKLTSTAGNLTVFNSIVCQVNCMFIKLFENHTVTHNE